MRRVLISLFWNPARTARSCWYPEGEIVKSDKSPSQIRDRKFRIGRMVVQLQISDLGFKMQDSSDFKIPSHRCSVSQVCRSPLRGGEYIGAAPAATAGHNPEPSEAGLVWSL